MSKQASLSVAELLGPNGPGMGRALKASREYLRARDISGLLANVGETIDSIPPAAHLGKHFIQASYVKDRGKPPDDLVTGQGVFYITEQRRLFLDGTAGHYQMTWGYNHPELNAIVQRAIEEGIVWDDHNNVPGNAVKRLSARLVEVANGVGAEATPLIDDGDALNTVLLGVCTGSVAASSALKIVLKHHEVARPNAEPVIVAINGNYHGTDFFAQRLRGMWEPYVRRMKVVLVEPNDIEGIRRVFETHGDRTAAFFAEPILMNREAISLDEDFMREARALCDEADACMVLDEIQTGFWCPEVFMFRQYGIVPDILIIGKGMTAGFHPLAATVYKRKYDRLEQYDAISTNGNAPLASLVALGCIALIERDRDRIGELGRYYFERLEEIPAKFPERVATVHGKGLLAGLKFRRVEDALAFHQRCIERGLWVRAHAYHEGHSTVLTKLALCADKEVADFVVEKFMETLAGF